jgi:hypothetical protein
MPIIVTVPCAAGDQKGTGLVLTPNTSNELNPLQAIRRVLVSKACRGAIMFGDKLSRHQCDQVVSALIACALPFQCAHGRPTLVPLLRLAATSQASAASDNGCHKGANAPPPQLPKHASSSAYDMHPPPQLPKPEWARWRLARRKGSM